MPVWSQNLEQHMDSENIKQPNKGKVFEGDLVNSYDDGPLENGDQLGPFYELETYS